MCVYIYSAPVLMCVTVYIYIYIYICGFNVMLLTVHSAPTVENALVSLLF